MTVPLACPFLGRALPLGPGWQGRDRVPVLQVQSVPPSHTTCTALNESKGLGPFQGWKDGVVKTLGPPPGLFIGGHHPFWYMVVQPPLWRLHHNHHPELLTLHALETWRRSRGGRRQGHHHNDAVPRRVKTTSDQTTGETIVDCEENSGMRA